MCGQHPVLAPRWRLAANRPATPGQAGDAGDRESYLRRLLGGVRVIAGDPLLRCLIALALMPVHPCSERPRLGRYGKTVRAGIAVRIE